MRPANQIAQRVLIALRKKFDASVRAILHPARQPKSSSFALSARTEEDPLDPSSNQQMDLLECHVDLLGS